MENVNPLMQKIKLPGRTFQLPSRGALYANGEIIGEFYSVSDIKEIIKYIQSKLVKNIN